MKKQSPYAGAVRAVLVLAVAVILAACAPPLDSRGEGNLRIVLSGGAPSGARSIDPETEAGLSYRLYFSGPGGEARSEILNPGTRTYTFTLSLGQWTIRAEAFTADGNLCGSGETTVTVEAGRTKDAAITMKAFADIAAFSFAALAATGDLNTEAKTIAVTVPSGTDLTSLVPTIDFRGLTIAPPSGEAWDFANPVEYTVTAANGSIATWTVTVTVVSNTANDITAFSFTNPVATGIVNAGTKTIAVTVPYGTNRNGLTPAITLSPGATISPESGTAQNFTDPVVYTVTAADGSPETWTVTVTVAPDTASAANDITAFNFATPPATGIINTGMKTITVTVPYGTNRNGLTPAITLSPGATIDPASAVAQNFGSPVEYTVIAENGSTATWTVTVTVEAPVALTTVAAVTAYLATATGGDTANPVPLVVTLNLADPGGNGWTELLGAIQAQTPEKHVALDLSACTMSGMTSTVGEFDPGAADTGESKIVSLILPEAATSIAAGSYPDNTFRYFTGLKSVTGENVTVVGDNAFNLRTSLRSVSLPKATSIGDGAFSNCTLMTSINLPAVISVGISAFFNCANMTSVSFPEARDIGSDAFRYCGSLVSVNLPVVTSIVGSAFDRCTALVSVSLPTSLASISGNPFTYCYALTNITVDESNTVYKHSDDKKMLLSKDGTILIAYPSATGTTPTLPGTITSIGHSAFYGCTGLREINFPNGVTSIDGYAFTGCTSLETVSLPGVTSIDYDAFYYTGTIALTVILGDTIPTLGWDMFYNITAKTVTVKVPNNPAWSGIIGTYNSTDTTSDNWGNGFRGGGWNGTAMTDPSRVNANIALTIDSPPLPTLNTVAAVTAHLASATGGTATNPIPLAVTLNLADTTGNGWAGLLGAIGAANKYVDLDLSACTITGMTSTLGEFDPGYAISAGKNRIVSLVLPTAATSIADSAPSNSQSFTGLVRITGANIEDTGLYTFAGCDALESANLPKVEIVDRYAFSACTVLTTVNFPVVQNIEAFAFSGCADLILTSLPNSVTNIGQQAFESCYGLTLTSLPSGLTFLGDAAFRRCNLSSISIPASLDSIGANPFGGCSFLTTITVVSGNPNYKAESGKLLSKDGKTLISYPSAAGAVSLSGIETLGASAFIFCANLTSVELPDVASIRASAFVSTGTTALTITLGETVPELGEGLFASVVGPKTVTVKVPVGATAWTDIGMYDPADPTGCIWWGNGFRGGGWNGYSMTNSSVVNSGITVTIEQPDYLFVSDSGNNVTGNGSEVAPYATVDQALTRIQADYSDLLWPVDSQSVPVPARIRITGTITEAGTANAMVQIGNPGSSSLYETYPPIILEGDGTLNADGQNRVLLVVWADLTLSGNLTLTGGMDMPGAGVMVGGSGEDGKFTMEGGTITGNRTTLSYSDGGGVYVASGEFIMKGGTISNNHTDYSTSHGGGVAVSAGMPGDSPVFTMIDGTISDNEATSNGGGVYVQDGTFIMSGGIIGGTGDTANANTASNGGGVYVYTGGTFTMSGTAVVSKNTTTNQGGGVYVYTGGTFTMNDGTISGNEVTNSGGGVYVYTSGTFTMNDGIISGNEASAGGGVYVYGGTFTKTAGGIIYGNTQEDNTTPEDPTLQNTATSGYAVGGDRTRNATAGSTVNLNSANSAGTGGWDP